MPLRIRHPEAERLARALAEVTGESLTDAVLHALRERLQRVAGQRHGRGLPDEAAPVQARVARLPVLDDRTDEALIGYDEHGLLG